MKINILKKGKKFYITNNHFNYDIKRNFTIFQNSFIKTNDIVYRKNIDIVCAKDLFFYTILNVDRYKYFLPYVTLKNKIYQNFMNLYIKELGKKILYSFINESKSNSYKNTDVLHLIK
ncbi:hypothetical protein PFBG_02035 [Plasmodium falciparum 7G8]|uniref:Uncharacterized protein n=1 Tax=Plasmodium falciparum (isolate 7G8) TaxID=57266 RepID=W7FEY7_PLAF8|nr:hypothetical protein PFBG_02035 [Plasmodium falciparum 7G8]